MCVCVILIKGSYFKACSNNKAKAKINYEKNRKA